MIVSTTTYLYVDGDANQYYIQGGELIDRGVWDMGAIYQRLHAVEYDGGLYVALVSNSGQVPTGFVDENWSSLVIIREDATVNAAGSDYYARLAAWQAQLTAQVGTNVAYTALFTAWAGTNAAALGGAEAYVMAVSGTELARLALQIASEGTNTGTAALGRADYAIELASAGTSAAQFAIEVAASGTTAAQFAINLAAAGTNVGRDALALAAAGTSAAQFAISVAVSGTQAAQFAISLAASGTSAAQSAFSVAVAGTDAAANAAAIGGAAYVLATLGTVPPPLSTLPDVSIPAPAAQQVLTYSGSVWIASDAPSTTSPQALTSYPEDVASGTAGYATLSPTPLGLPENVDIVTISVLNVLTPFEGYLSNQVNRTSIDAGVWELNTYGAVSNVSREAWIVTDVYKRDITGSEVYLFSGTTGPYLTLTPVLLADIVVQGSIACSLTDRFVAKYSALRKSNPASVDVSFYHSGTDHASHIHTPLGVSHNDLRGLQGGTTDQYYHVTVDQKNALAGSTGYPDATNVFVTTTDPRLYTAQAQADLALRIASIGTNTGTAAYDLATLAYNLASMGTNTGTAALGRADYAIELASAGTAAANAALALAWTGTASAFGEAGSRVFQDTAEGFYRAYVDGTLITRLAALEHTLGVGWSGTATIWTSMVRNAPADTKIVVIDGVITSRVDSTYAVQTFDHLDSGSVSTMSGQGAWASPGEIVVCGYGTRIGCEDYMGYAAGTVTTPLTGGTGWSGSGVVVASYFSPGGTETFESWSLGTVATGVIPASFGKGWSGTGVVSRSSIYAFGSETFEDYALGTYVTGDLNAGGEWGGPWTIVSY